MAQNSTRNYVLACTIPAAVAVATYFWVKKKKKRQRTPRRRIISSFSPALSSTDIISIEVKSTTNSPKPIAEEIHFTESVAEEIHRTESVTEETNPTESVAIDTNCTELVAADANCIKSVGTEIILSESTGADTVLSESLTAETNLTDSPQVYTNLTETNETVLSSQINSCLHLTDCKDLNTSKSLSDSVCEVEDNLNNSCFLDMAAHAAIVHYNDICSLPTYLISPSSQPFIDSELNMTTTCSTYDNTAFSDTSSGYNVDSGKDTVSLDTSAFSSDDSIVLSSNELDEKSSPAVESAAENMLTVAFVNDNEESTNAITIVNLNETVTVVPIEENVSTETSVEANLDEQYLRVVEGNDIKSNGKEECEFMRDVPLCVVAPQFEQENAETQELVEGNSVEQCEEKSSETQHCIENDNPQSSEEEIAITQCEMENAEAHQCLETSAIQQYENDSKTHSEVNSEISKREEVISVEVHVNAETQMDQHQQPPASPSLSVEETELQNLVIDNIPSAYGSSSHSPAELGSSPLDSPPNGHPNPPYPEFHSEGSSDSGKGGSDIQAPSMAENYVNNTRFPAIETFVFSIPQHHCGRLIGHKGQNVKSLKSNSGADIVIYDNPLYYNIKFCAVRGSKRDIHAALDIIRSRFPASKYPEITLHNVNSYTMPISPAIQLHIPGQSTCHVLLSATITPGHFFLQQPTHPTYPQLEYLTGCMNAAYSQEEAPQAPLEENVICVINYDGVWYRVYIGEVNSETSECVVKFLDYGGYMTTSQEYLKQLRFEFATLPFQAEECFLARVGPANGDIWTPEARECFQELASGIVLEATVVEYNQYGTPMVFLNRTKGTETIFINEELVKRGHAVWIEK